MDNQFIDHTKQLETRLKAIRIRGGDSCVFFSQRHGGLTALKQCQYCQYAVLDLDCEDYNALKYGFCKFKR